MPEMVIPGTYIDVRAEGLISAGGVTTGIVGVIGTASSGPVGAPVTLSGMAEANDLFGPPDNFTVPTDGANPLTLTRALQYVYGNGGSTVVAVRVARVNATQGLLSFFAYFFTRLAAMPHKRNSAPSGRAESSSAGAVSIASQSPA